MVDLPSVLVVLKLKTAGVVLGRPDLGTPEDCWFAATAFHTSTKTIKQLLNLPCKRLVVLERREGDPFEIVEVSLDVSNHGLKQCRYLSMARADQLLHPLKCLELVARVHIDLARLR